MNRSSSSGRSTSRSILFSVDLASTLPNLLLLMDRWQPIKRLASNEPALRKILRRYERFWLPLLAEKEQLDLEPPSDVAWLWHYHLIAQPDESNQTYQAYCRQRFGRVLNYRLRRYDAEIVAAKSRSASLWKDMFPTEPFELEHRSLSTGHVTQLNATRIDHVVTTALRERQFEYDIDLPHFRDQSFQYAAVERYKNYIAIARHHLLVKNVLPVMPTLPLDIQLVWRAHMMHPTSYEEDMKRNLQGRHNIDLRELLSLSALESFVQARQVWMSVAKKDNLFLSGTMSRGDHTLDGRLVTRLNRTISIRQFRAEVADGSTVETCEVFFNSACVDELWTKQKKFNIDAHLIGSNSFSLARIFSLQGSVGKYITPENSGSRHGVSSNDLGRTLFDSKRNRGIELQISGRKGFGCVSRDQLICRRMFNPLQYIPQSNCLDPDTTHRLDKQQIILPKISYTDPKIVINVSIKSAARKPIVLTLDRNQAESTQLPEPLAAFLERCVNWATHLPPPKQRSDPTSNEFMCARHSLKCREVSLAFGVEVTKHACLPLCAIRVYHNNQNLVAVAYSIDANQLPLPDEVLETCPVIFDASRDQAMLIRDHSGDVAVVSARYNIDASGKGVVNVRTYSFGSRRTLEMDIREDELESIRTDQVRIDLPTGRITAYGSPNKIVETVAWSFCVGCLYVAVQRRALVTHQPSEAGSSTSPTASVNRRSRLSAKLQVAAIKKANKRRKMSASFTFLLACGLQIEAALSAVDLQQSTYTSYHSYKDAPNESMSRKPSDRRALINDDTFNSHGPMGAQINGSISKNSRVGNGSWVGVGTVPIIDAYEVRL